METPTKKKSPIKVIALVLGTLVGVSHIGLLGYVVNNRKHEPPVINIPHGPYSSYKIKAGNYIDEYIVIWRDEFIEDNWAELYEHTVTLCHNHHVQLHGIYGRNPSLATADKQKNWVEIQRTKHGMV